MISCEDLDENSAMQAACDTSIARDTECVCIPSWRIQVGGPPASARVNRTKAFSLVLRTETVHTRIEGDMNRHVWNSVVYQKSKYSVS